MKKFQNHFKRPKYEPMDRGYITGFTKVYKYVWIDVLTSFTFFLRNKKEMIQMSKQNYFFGRVTLFWVLAGRKIIKLNFENY